MSVSINCNLRCVENTGVMSPLVKATIKVVVVEDHTTDLPRIITSMKRGVVSLGSLSIYGGKVRVGANAT